MSGFFLDQGSRFIFAGSREIFQASGSPIGAGAAAGILIAVFANFFITWMLAMARNLGFKRAGSS
jgi:hypothetical protein